MGSPVPIPSSSEGLRKAPPSSRTVLSLSQLTPLAHAVRGSHVELVMMLVERGACPTDAASGVASPLGQAFAFGHAGESLTITLALLRRCQSDAERAAAATAANGRGALARAYAAGLRSHDDFVRRLLVPLGARPLALWSDALVSILQSRSPLPLPLHSLPSPVLPLTSSPPPMLPPRSPSWLLAHHAPPSSSITTPSCPHHTDSALSGRH